MKRLSMALPLLALLAACGDAARPEPAVAAGSVSRSVAYCTPNYGVAPIPNTQSGNFNRTTEVCFTVQNAGPLAFNCSNMQGRTVTVNGTPYSASSCDGTTGSSVTVPDANGGTFYFDVSAGGLPYASIAFWAGSGSGGSGGGSCTATLSAGQKWSDRYNLNVTVTGASDWVVTMTLPSPEVMIATWNIDPTWPPPGNVLVAKPNGSGNSWGVTIKHNGNWTWPAVTCVSKDPPPPPPSIEYDVAIDPYGHSPLAAVINLRGVGATQLLQVTVIVAGKYGGQDFQRTYLPADAVAPRFDSSDLTFPVSGFHVPVVGLYDGENQVRIVTELTSGTVDDTLSVTSPLTHPGEGTWLPGIALATADASRMEPGWTVAEINVEKDDGSPVINIEWARRVAFDEVGAVRWALRLDGVFAQWGDTVPMARGHDGTFFTGADDQLLEVNELGRILRTFEVPGYSLHHETTQIGGEQAGDPSSPHYLNVLALATKVGASTIQDRIIELDHATGTVIQEWDLAATLDPTRTIFTDKQGWKPASGDWCHANGLAYSAADDRIVVSCRHQGVAKIARDGTLDWILAPHAAWNPPWSAKLLQGTCATGTCGSTVQDGYGAPSDGSFDWPFGQHSPVLLANGDLLLFDNGASRYFKGGCAASRAVIYRVDPASMAVRQVSAYVLDASRSSCFVSNVVQLPRTGDFFVQSGGTQSRSSVAREVTASVAADGTITFGSDVVFDATLDLSAVGADLGNVFVYSYRGHRWEF